MATRPLSPARALIVLIFAFLLACTFHCGTAAAAQPVPGVPLAPATDPDYAATMRYTRTTTVTRHRGNWPAIRGRVPCFPRIRWLISPCYRQAVRGR